jgi:hypothetical protein
MPQIAHLFDDNLSLLRRRPSDVFCGNAPQSTLGKPFAMFLSEAIGAGWNKAYFLSRNIWPEGDGDEQPAASKERISRSA